MKTAKRVNTKIIQGQMLAQTVDRMQTQVRAAIEFLIVNVMQATTGGLGSPSYQGMSKLQAATPVRLLD